MTTEINPFPKLESCEITVDEYLVPNIQAHLLKGTEDEWSVILDQRFGITASGEEIKKWMPIVANAMAIAAGYSCFGENSE